MTPVFKVGDVSVYGDVILAPMAGFSDVPYRALCRAYGSAMHYTEFVPAETLLGAWRDDGYWRRLDKQAGERPLVFQIFGSDAETLLAAAQNILQLEPDVIDVNMGCSTRRVSGRGAGAGMMPQPELVAETFRLLSTHLPVPVTGKMRLGWDASQPNFRQIGRIMEENGAAMIAIHGRTKAQKYNGRADWNAIAALKEAVEIPVIGNGDVTAPGDIDRMLAYTGCDAVMVGRAARGNPWIFARRDKETVTVRELFAVIRRHLAEMLAYYGAPLGLVRFRKHLKRYLAGYEVDDELLLQMLTAVEVDHFRAHLDHLQRTLIEQERRTNFFYNSEE